MHFSAAASVVAKCYAFSARKYLSNRKKKYSTNFFCNFFFTLLLRFSPLPLFQSEPSQTTSFLSKKTTLLPTFSFFGFTQKTPIIFLRYEISRIWTKICFDSYPKSNLWIKWQHIYKFGCPIVFSWMFYILKK